jgi:hypothetical protein
MCTCLLQRLCWCVCLVTECIPLLQLSALDNSDLDLQPPARYFFADIDVLKPFLAHADHGTLEGTYAISSH